MARGEFDELEGKGQPLKLEDESNIPEELRLAYKILKMADCLPPEIELKKDIIRLQDLVANMPDEQEKLKHMRRLQFFVMKLNMMRQVSPLLQEYSDYTEKIINRLETCSQPPTKK